MIWGLVLIFGVIFLPESPYVLHGTFYPVSPLNAYHIRRHLIGIGRSEEARQVIADMNATCVDDPLVLEAMEELEIGIRAENEGGKATWIECFSTRNMLWKRTINGMVLQSIQQFNGQNFCMFSSAAMLSLFFFRNAILTVFYFSLQIIFTVILFSHWLVRRYHRMPFKQSWAVSPLLAPSQHYI
jgi:MFS transporter, SP family, sugar:H+ symporter